MSETHRVILTADALADLTAIADHIRRDSPQGAASMAAGLYDAIDSLTSMPTRFRRAGPSRKRATPVYSMVVRPYIVYYRVEQITRVVYVVNIRHGSRRQPRRFD